MATCNQSIWHLLKRKIEELKREILYHQELKVLIALLLFLVAFFLLSRVLTVISVREPSETDNAGSIAEKNASSESHEQKEPRPIFVYITGAVEKPGVYRLKEGSRLFELLERAVPKKDSAAHLLNQAQILEDGEMIYIPTFNEASQVASSLAISSFGSSSGSGFEKSAGKININTASEEELVKIPGVGIKTAQKIIEFRKKKGRISSLEELLEIEGIGEKKLEKMKDFIKF